MVSSSDPQQSLPRIRDYTTTSDEGGEGRHGGGLGEGADGRSTSTGSNGTASTNASGAERVLSSNHHYIDCSQIITIHKNKELVVMSDENENIAVRIDSFPSSYFG